MIGQRDSQVLICCDTGIARVSATSAASRVRVIFAPHQLDPGAGERRERGFERGDRGGLGLGPARAFEHGEAARLVRLGRRRWPDQAGIARIAAGASGDFTQQHPRILDAGGERAVHALATARHGCRRG